MSLSKALDNQVKTDVGWDIIDDSNGLAMMDRLEKELGLTTLHVEQPQPRGNSKQNEKGKR